MFFSFPLHFFNFQSPTPACVRSAAFAISNLIRELPEIAEWAGHTLLSVQFFCFCFIFVSIQYLWYLNVLSVLFFKEIGVSHLGRQEQLQAQCCQCRGCFLCLPGNGTFIHLTKAAKKTFPVLFWCLPLSGEFLLALPEVHMSKILFILLLLRD